MGDRRGPTSPVPSQWGTWVRWEGTRADPLRAQAPGRLKQEADQGKTVKPGPKTGSCSLQGAADPVYYAQGEQQKMPSSLLSVALGSAKPGACHRLG